MSFIELFDFIIYQYLNIRELHFTISHLPNSPFMLPVYSCLHCQFLSHVLKSLFFNQNSPKMKLFLQKNAKFLSVGGSTPKPPCLRRLGALPPNPQPPAAGCFAPRPPLASGGLGLRPQTPKTAPHSEFLATRLGSHKKHYIKSAMIFSTSKTQRKMRNFFF